MELTANNNEKKAQLILGIIKKHLGKDSKLSEFTESQQETLEVIINDMREL